MTTTTTIDYERTTDADGIVTVVIDEPGAKVNTMNDYYSAAMQATVEWLEANVDDITGVVLTSPKKTFFAGGNLNQIRQASPETAEAEFAQVERVKSVLRRLESFGKHVVEKFNGAVHGGRIVSAVR